MRRWFSDQTNLVLIVAIATTVFGLVAVTADPRNGAILAFAGTLWLVWSSIQKERNRRNRDRDDDDEEGPIG